MLLEQLESLDLADLGVHVLNVFYGFARYTLISVLVWVVALCIVDHHDLAFAYEVFDLLLILTIGVVSALFQVERQHIPVNRCRMSRKHDLGWIVKAKCVWPESFLNCSLTFLEIVQICLFVVVGALVVWQSLILFCDSAVTVRGAMFQGDLPVEIAVH